MLSTIRRACFQEISAGATHSCRHQYIHREAVKEVRKQKRTADNRPGEYERARRYKRRQADREGMQPDVAHHDTACEASGRRGRQKRLASMSRRKDATLATFRKGGMKRDGHKKTVEAQIPCVEITNDSRSNGVHQTTSGTGSIYQPLDDSKNEIRLLNILPLEKTDDDATESIVKCTLCHFSLDDRPEYTALSYAWGDPNDTVPILVNDHVIGVTTNLEAALRQFREDGLRILWADGVCINQSDTNEKNHQVKKMKNVYQSATEVIAWLGVQADTSDLAIDTIHELGGFAIANGIRDLPSLMSLGDQQRKTVHDRMVELLAHGYIGTLLSLFRRTYWGRLWVLQEVALARSVVFACGVKRVEWALLYAFSNTLWSTVMKNEEDRHLEMCSIMAAVVLTKARYSVERVLGLSNLYGLTCTGRLETSDDRDRVFGLLGLLEETQRADIAVDYSLPLRQVYIQAACSMLHRDGLTTLQFCGILNRSPENGLPSWVPDWRVDHWPHFLKPHLFKASGVTKAPGLDFGSCQIGVLGLRIAWVDTVVHLFDIPPEWTGKAITKFINAVGDYLDSHRLLRSPSDVRAIPEAVLRVLVVDQYYTEVSNYERLNEQHLQELRKIPDDIPYESDSRFDFPRASRTSVFLSSKGYIGRGQKGLQAGDRIGVTIGYPFPVLLRPATGGRYRFISTLYVHGVMDGEFMDQDPPIEHVELE